MNELENRFRAFALAALRVSAPLIESLTADEQAAVSEQLQAGARLELSFGPVPDFQHVQLLLVGRDDERRTLTSISLNPKPMLC